MEVRQRDTTYLVGFLLAAGVLLFLGRDLLQGSVLASWGLTFAGTTAVAVLGVSLYRVRIDLQTSRKQLARKEAELNFALEVQLALFPRQMPLCGGLEFTGVCIPAQGIGGDYYDVMRLPDGRVIFAIADISGKGISAAILMANLQASLRTLAGISDSPGDICARLNNHLHEVTDASKFATFFYAEWDGCDRRLRYVNAGHLPPIVSSNGGHTRLTLGGVPLGIFRGAAFEVGDISLEPGDMIVLYSDGVTEAPAGDGEQFGDHRLERVIKENRDRPLSEVQARILDAVHGWSEEPEDDMTLLIARATLQPKEIQ
ncbi:MAG TPA: PP2C family protein-serine/threonine phosphatase [Blastocatellia bacterium]|nr:PP2C family protein-serine/threonine phosphatase [Blastocatellia bacterium]